MLPAAPITGGVTRRGVDWLLKSGIQHPSGGVARLCRTDTWEYRAVSNEITGYAASALLYLHRVTGLEECLEAAVRAGHYLTRTAWKPALASMPFECQAQGELAYFFDLGIVARALVALWRATGEEEFLGTAAACAESMARDFRGPSGYHPVLTLPDKQPVAGDGRWSRQPGCYQLKAALAWDEVAGAGAGDQYRALYEGAVEASLASQAAFLEGEPDRERLVDRLHAYCYFLEGLLLQASSPDCARALGEGMERAGRLLREIRPVFERSDVWAQLLRLRLYAAALGAVPLDRQRAREEAAAIPSFQLLDADRRAAGGFRFGRKAGAPMPFVNPVSTVFALQALALWEEHAAGRFRADLRDLI
jgi:hypothetical protein